VAYLEISLRNSMSNGKESGMFFKAVVVVVAVVVAVGAGLAKRCQCRTVYSLVVELRLSFFNR